MKLSADYPFTEAFMLHCPRHKILHVEATTKIHLLLIKSLYLLPPFLSNEPGTGSAPNF
jgi:hypothetical protein